MSDKLFRSTKLLVRCVEPGAFKTRDTPAVPPKTKEEAVGTVFKPSDFSKEEFTALYNDGTLVEHEVEETDAAAAFYGNPPGDGELVESEEKRLERLHNEAKMLGVTGVTKNMKADTIEKKIADHKNSRPADGTTPSTQDGAGRADPSDGNTDGEGAGGDAEGAATDDVIG